MSADEIVVSKQHIHRLGMDLIEVSLQARSKTEAMEQLRERVALCTRDELRRVVVMLAVTIVWRERRRSTSRALRDWLLLQRHEVDFSEGDDE